MQFLNRTIEQTKDLFGSMTPGARITTGLLLVVVVVSLSYLFVFQWQGTGNYLMDGEEFTGSEISKMTTAFHQAGLTNWTREGYRIRIPYGSEAQYMGALASNDALPRDFDQIFEDMLASGSPFESREERQRKSHVQREQYLAKILRYMPDVAEATVQVSIKKGNGFRATEELTALAAVAARGNQGLSTEMIESIRVTVSSSFAGLQPEYVTVTDLVKGRAYPGSGNQAGQGQPEDEYQQRKKDYETYWRDKIYDGLSMYPNVVVGVNVELDPRLRSDSNEVKYDPRATATETISSSTTSESNPAGGRPGAAPNLVTGNRPQRISTVGQDTHLEKTHEEQRSVTGFNQTSTQMASLTPKEVRASIGIPRSYLVKIWQKYNPPAEGASPRVPTADELQQTEDTVSDDVTRAVVAMLPKKAAGMEQYPDVNVQFFEEIDSEVAAADSVTEATTGWLANNWSSIGMILVALVGLFVFRGMLKSTSPPDPAQVEETPIASDSIPMVPASEEEGDEPVLNRFRVEGPDLRNELASIVREDPDAAANVLRSWIGDAA